MADKSPTAVAGPSGLLPGGAGDRPPLLGRLLQGQEVMIGAIAIALALYFTFSSANFGTASNGQTLSIYMAPIIFFAVAEVFILILGEIDLAVGEVYVLTPFIVAYMANDGVGVVAGIFIALIVSCMVGFVNGFITVKLRVPSFITTLGTVYALQGIVLITSNATQINTAGTGLTASILGAWPWAEIAWALFAVAVLHVVLRKTTFGLHTVAIGGNELAAREAGIKVDAVKIWCFVLCSFLGGLMGLLDGYHIGSLNPGTNGLNFMFYGVAAAVIGGTALTGGRGTMIGAGIGAVVLGILEDGLLIKGASAFFFYLILGLAILGAMILNVQLERVKARFAPTGRRGSMARVLLRGGGVREKREEAKV